MANSAGFPFNELRFPGNEQQQQQGRRRRRHNELDPFKIGAKLSAAQFLSASLGGGGGGELLALRGRYSHSSQVFAAAAADICIDPFRACVRALPLP